MCSSRVGGLIEEDNFPDNFKQLVDKARGVTSIGR